MPTVALQPHWNESAAFNVASSGRVLGESLQSMAPTSENCKAEEHRQYRTGFSMELLDKYKPTHTEVYLASTRVPR
jgi:hypothetical protein